MYLAGYAVELALKARICKLLDLPNYPESRNDPLSKTYKTHGLADLKTLAGLNKLMSASNPTLLANWSVVAAWNETLRYVSPGTATQAATQQFLNSMIDKPNGVLTWLMKRW